MQNNTLKDFLSELGLIDEQSGLIKIPCWVKRIRIDVGLSSNAPHSSIWLSEDEQLLVFGFEPNTRNINKLRTGTSEWPIKIDKHFIDEKLILIPIALGNVNGVVDKIFYDAKVDSGQSSIYKPKEIEIIDSYSVKCGNISEFINLIPNDRFPFIEYLKTDCQGADFEILLSAKPVLKRIAVYTLELERFQYEGTDFTATDIHNVFLEARFVKYNFISALFKRLNPFNFSVKDPTYINSELLSKIKNVKARFIQLS